MKCKPYCYLKTLLHVRINESKLNVRRGEKVQEIKEEKTAIVIKSGA